MKLTIVRILTLLFAVLSAACVLSLATHYWLLKKSGADQDLLEAVTQLRTRTSRVHWILNRARIEPSDLSYLKTSLPSLKEAIEALDKGGIAFGRRVRPIEAEFAPQMQALKQKWQVLELGLKDIAALDDPQLADSAPNVRLHPQINELESQVIGLHGLVEARREPSRAAMFRVMLLLSGATVLLLLAGAIVIYKRVVWPIRLLTSGNQAIRRGDFSQRVPVPSEDELGALGRSFNEMAERLQRFVSDQEAMVKQLTDAVQELKDEVDERRKVEERLRQSEARLEAAQSMAHVGNWEVDLRASQLYWSNEVYRIYGIEPREGAEPHSLFWNAVHPDDLDRVRSASKASHASAKAYEIEHRIVRPDGSVRFVREHAEIVTDESGRAARMIGTVQDITEERRIEEQFRQSVKMEAIGRLAGGVAHDFNNMLTVMGGYAEMLLSSETNQSTQSGLQEILRASDRAGALTHQLLAFSRQQILQPGVLQLNAVVESMENLVKRLIGEQFTLHSVLDPDLRPVFADQSQLEQVIMNLIVNARDAMPAGGTITVETVNVSMGEAYTLSQMSLPAGDYVMMTVTDQGSGMDEKTKARVFEPFFTTKERGKGTGLGLSTVYGIVKQSGGDISIYSELGRGTSMRVYLPSTTGSWEAPVERQVGQKPERQSGKILLVEDDDDVRRLTRAILEDCGYRVVDTGSGPEALRMLDDDRLMFDLLVSDIIMPGMDGVQLQEEVSRRIVGIRTVFMSGYSENTLHLTPGAFYLSKPFTPSGLAQKVSEALGYPAHA